VWSFLKLKEEEEEEEEILIYCCSNLSLLFKVN
jgi:hypothetical protein